MHLFADNGRLALQLLYVVEFLMGCNVVNDF